MEEKLRKLADLRRELLRLDGLYRQAKVDWEENNVELIEKRNWVTTELLAAETLLKAEALDQYRLDKNTKPAPGIEIKNFQVLDYPEKDALAWALKTGMAIKLDKAAFEKIAKVSPMDFVFIDDEPRCQIATDLDKVLEGEKL